MNSLSFDRCSIERLLKGKRINLAEIDSQIARRSLAKFIRQGWHVLEPTTPLAWNWHIEAIAIHIEAAFEGWAAKQEDPDAYAAYQNLLINIPPGTAKSRIVSVFAPAWAWLRWPSWRGIFLSSNPRVALRDSIYCRDLIESDWYRRSFSPDWRLSPDQNAKGLFRNTAGGFRQAMGISARITGDRADGLFVDDPHDAEEVLSETSRTEVTNRWNDAIANRVNDLRSSIRIGVMQRLHEKDWSGTVLSQGGWEHLCLPMEFEPDRRHVTAIGWTDPRTIEGELLFPERFPIHVLEAEKKRLGPYGYAGQHQQRPAPRDGGMFRLADFKTVDAVPAQFVTMARYWDLAGAAPGKGDWTVGVLMGKCKDGLYWIVDVSRFQKPANERTSQIVAIAHQDKRNYGGKVRTYVEQPPGLAKEPTEDTIRALAGFVAEADRVNGDKPSRAEPFAAQCRAGNVRMMSAPWNEPYLAIMCVFNNGVNDDDVDASSGAFNRIAMTPIAMSPRYAAMPEPMKPAVGY